MKILIQDRFNDTERKFLEEGLIGHHLKFVQKISQKDVDEAQIILGNPSSDLDIKKEHIKMIQLRSAGSDTFVNRIHPNTLLCNASGCYGVPLSEHVLALLLALSKNIPVYIHHMDQHLWKNLHQGKEVFQSRVCIVGCGDLGSQTAKRLCSFDCHITGIKRRNTKQLKYFDEIKTIDELDDIIGDMDTVILCLPHTKETNGLFNKERLLKMKKDAILINVGRGSAIIHDDLIEVLPYHLGGVGLDVTDPEPLPLEDPLWSNPKVLITPHSAGGFTWKSTRDKYIRLCLENVRRMTENRPCLNLVDLDSGYRIDVK